MPRANRSTRPGRKRGRPTGSKTQRLPIVVVAPTPCPYPGCGATDNPADKNRPRAPRRSLKAFVAKFGEEYGRRWFGERLSFADAWRLQFGRYVERYGAPHAVEYFSAGLPFSEADALYVPILRAELSALEQAHTDEVARLRAELERATAPPRQHKSPAQRSPERCRRRYG